MHGISVLVFLCFCCFISTIPLNRSQLAGTQGPYSMNTTQTVAGAGGNRSGDLVDYDLGLSDQAKDSISAGRGNRLFQFPFKGKAQTKAKDTEFPEEKPISVLNEKRKPRANDREGHEEGKEEGGEGEGEGEGGEGGEAGEEEEEEGDEEEDVEEDEGLDYDEEEAEEDKVSKGTLPKPQPKPKAKPASDDKEESDDVDDDLLEILPTKTDNNDQSIGFKDLLMPKVTVGKQDDRAVGITYGPSRAYTRREEWRSALARAGIMSDPLDDYHPSNFKDLSSVCAKKSTIMNFPKVIKWIHKVLTNITYTKRPIYFELRRELYEFGQSEICHKTEMIEWKDYQYCALIRNQRMEYMIPHYPLHQIGYRMLYKVHRGPYDLDVLTGK